MALKQFFDDTCTFGVKPYHGFVNHDKRQLKHEDTGDYQFLAHAV